MKKTVYKTFSNDKFDYFHYRDEYNEERVITFPKTWKMTEKQVLNNLEFYKNQELKKWETEQ